MSVADKDIYRTAKLLIEQHGAGAWIEAAVKHREMVANGDEEGAAVWLGAPTREPPWTTWKYPARFIEGTCADASRIR